MPRKKSTDGYKVYVTRQLPEPGIERLKDAREVAELRVFDEDRVMKPAELRKAVKWCDALLCLLTDTIDGKLLDANPGLKVVANYAVGYDNVDVPAATERGIVVTNTPGVLTDTTADLTWALLMSVARRIVHCDRCMRGGEYRGWSPMFCLGFDVYGKTLGIVGMGQIGTAVARRAKGFDMNVIYHEAHRKSAAEEKRLGIRYASLSQLLKRSDFVSLHVPLTPKTHHLISTKQLGAMKPTAFLINTSRGPIIDERALVQALKKDVIAGAALDVFECEPKMAPGLAQLENVVVAPHIGSASVETRTKMALMAADNILAILRGKKPPNPVNPEVLKR